MVEQPQAKPPVRENNSRPTQKTTEAVKPVERPIARPPLTTFTNPSE